MTEALDGYYWKPVQCGHALIEIGYKKVSFKRAVVILQLFPFVRPVLPIWQQEKKEFRIEAKNLDPSYLLTVTLIIEGTGGLLAPLNETETWADAASLECSLGIGSSPLPRQPQSFCSNYRIDETEEIFLFWE